MVDVPSLFEAHVRHFPKRGKLITDLQSGESVDLKGLCQKVEAARCYFHTIRHVPGDKVVLFLENSIDFIVVLLGLLDTDWVIVPLNPRLNQKKTDYLVRHSRAKLLVTSRMISDRTPWLKKGPCPLTFAEEIAGSEKIVRGSPDFSKSRRVRDDLKFILYTSGTVGSPKGVMLSGTSVALKVRDLVRLLKFRPGTAFFSFLPFFSGHGMIPGMLVPLFSGCRMFIAKFDPFLALKFWGLIKKHRVRYFTSVPSVLALLKEQAGRLNKNDLRSLKTVFSASARLPQSIYDWYVNRLGIRIHNCLGLTEAVSWVTVNDRPAKNEKADCIGRPLKGTICVLDQNGDPAGPCKTGELSMKTPYNLLGYFRDPKATRAAVTRDGFFKTGDVGYVASSGKIFFLDRIKQIIIKNGINVYPAEIDQVFLAHPKVKEAASFGVPDVHYGEEIITALVLQGNPGSKEPYLDHAARELPAFLVPRDILFLKALPRGATGKVLVRDLREQYLKEHP